MSWVTAGIAAAGAIKGGLDAKANRKQQAKNDHFRRTAIAYSPWTGMGDPGHMSAGNTDTMSGMLGGGLQGASIGLMGSQAGLWGGMGAGASGAAAGAASQPQMVGMVDPAMQQKAMNPFGAMGGSGGMYS